MIKIMN